MPALRIIFFIMLGLLCATVSIGAEDAPTSPKILTTLQQRLTAIMQHNLPDAHVPVTVKDGTMQIAYHTRQYLVYDRLMTGEYSDTPREVTGPTRDGLVLSLTWQPGAYRGQMTETNKLLTEQAPYWGHCYAVYTHVDTGCIFFDLKYGAHITPNLLADIQTAVQEAGDGK